MKKNTIITLIIIFSILAFSFYALRDTSEEYLVDPLVAQCIGENAHIYVQLGCPHCETQERMFGASYEYLTVTDCYYDRQACQDAQVRATPTWIINGERFEGVQTIEHLRVYTGC